MENLSFLGVPILKHIRVRLKWKQMNFANTVDPDEAAHYELPYLICPLVFEFSLKLGQSLFWNFAYVHFDVCFLDKGSGVWEHIIFSAIFFFKRRYKLYVHVNKFCLHILLSSAAFQREKMEENVNQCMLINMLS